VFFYSQEFLAIRPAPKLKFCRQFATVYSIYSKQLSISGGHQLNSQPENASCHVD